jgi:hypothetical protein
MNPAAQELVDRLIRLLANDVPAGHFKGAQHPHQSQIRVLSETRGVHAPPERLDIMRIMVPQVAIEDVLDHLRNEMWLKGHAIRLADSINAAICREFDENKIATAIVRRRISDDKRLDVRKLHGDRFPVGVVKSRPSVTRDHGASSLQRF